MVYKIPSYRISDFEIREILEPRYGIPVAIFGEFGRKVERCSGYWSISLPMRK